MISLPLLDPPYWNWWLLAVVLMALEMVAPGFFFLWMGIAAALVGVLLAGFPGLPVEWQWLIFALLSVGAIVGWQFWQRRHPSETDTPTLNRRGEQAVGRILVLDQPIVAGSGRAKLGDSTWPIRGPDLPAGTRVRVVAVDGTVLRVEALAGDG